jgi:hypothetical protein
MSNYDPHVLTIEDLLDEFDLNGSEWSDDEVREAFVSIVPDIRACLAVLNELYS